MNAVENGETLSMLVAFFKREVNPAFTKTEAILRDFEQE